MLNTEVERAHLIDYLFNKLIQKYFGEGTVQPTFQMHDQKSRLFEEVFTSEVHFLQTAKPQPEKSLHWS